MLIVKQSKVLNLDHIIFFYKDYQPKNEVGLKVKCPFKIIFVYEADNFVEFEFEDIEKRNISYDFILKEFGRMKTWIDLNESRYL